MDPVEPFQHTYRQAWFDSYWQLWVGLVTLSWTCHPVLDLSPCVGLVTLMWARALLSGNEGFRYHKAAASQRLSASTHLTGHILAVPVILLQE